MNGFCRGRQSVWMDAPVCIWNMRWMDHQRKWHFVPRPKHCSFIINTFPGLRQQLPFLLLLLFSPLILQPPQAAPPPPASLLPLPGGLGKRFNRASHWKAWMGRVTVQSWHDNCFWTWKRTLEGSPRVKVGSLASTFKTWKRRRSEDFDSGKSEEEEKEIRRWTFRERRSPSRCLWAPMSVRSRSSPAYSRKGGGVGGRKRRKRIYYSNTKSSWC